MYLQHPERPEEPVGAQSEQCAGTCMSAMVARCSGSTLIILPSRSLTSSDSGTREGNENWPGAPQLAVSFNA